MITWANNWNGVNHRYEPPEYDERLDKKPLGAAAAIERLDLVAELVRVSKPQPKADDPAAFFTEAVDWETAR